VVRHQARAQHVEQLSVLEKELAELKKEALSAACGSSGRQNILDPFHQGHKAGDVYKKRTCDV